MNYFYIIAVVCMLHTHINCSWISKWSGNKQTTPEQKVEPKIDPKLNDKLLLAIGDINELKSLLNPQVPWYKGGGTKSIPDINGKVITLLNSVLYPGLGGLADWTALMFASSRGKIDIVKLLLTAGAQPDLETPMGDTALCIAARFDKPDIMELLLEHGARPNTRFWKTLKGISKRDTNKGMKIMKVLEEYNKKIEQHNTEVEQERKAIEQATMDAFPEEAGWQHMSQIIGEYAAQPLAQKLIEEQETKADA